MNRFYITIIIGSIYFSIHNGALFINGEECEPPTKKIVDYEWV